MAGENAIKTSLSKRIGEQEPGIAPLFRQDIRSRLARQQVQRQPGRYHKQVLALMMADKSDHPLGLCTLNWQGLIIALAEQLGMGFTQRQYLADQMLFDAAVAPLVNFFIHLGERVRQRSDTRGKVD